MNPQLTYTSVMQLKTGLASFGAVYEVLLPVAAAVLALAAMLPQARRWRGWFLGGMAMLLLAGEAVLVRFHADLYRVAEVVSPDGLAKARVAVPLWVESEKLFVWAIMVAVLGMCMRRQRDDLMVGAMLITAALAFAAAVFGKPFTDPVPGFFGQYIGYLQAMGIGGQAAQQAYMGMEGARQGYYNAWYMWVHPPMLFLSYGAFALSFVATLQMIAKKHSSYETTSYRWARFGYLWLTLGMLLGFPWALAAWNNEAWWWSGKVNMSLMMWLLYTAHLHARLYLRRKNMWKAVAALGVLSFLILVMTYATTYIVPGAHSYASAAANVLRVAMLAMRGGA